MRIAFQPTSMISKTRSNVSFRSDSMGDGYFFKEGDSWGSYSWFNIGGSKASSPKAIHREPARSQQFSPPFLLTHSFRDLGDSRTLHEPINTDTLNAGNRLTIWGDTTAKRDINVGNDAMLNGNVTANSLNAKDGLMVTGKAVVDDSVVVGDLADLNTLTAGSVKIGGGLTANAITITDGDAEFGHIRRLDNLHILTEGTEENPTRLIIGTGIDQKEMKVFLGDKAKGLEVSGFEHTLNKLRFFNQKGEKLVESALDAVVRFVQIPSFKKAPAATLIGAVSESAARLSACL